MMLVIGLLFLVLGLASGTTMVLSPLGLMHAPDGFAVYLLFPGLCILGYLLLAMNVRTQVVAKLTQATGAALLCLALVAAVLLVVFATGMKVAEGGMAPLWYALAFGVIFGGAGMSLKSSENN